MDTDDIIGGIIFRDGGAWRIIGAAVVESGDRSWVEVECVGDLGGQTRTFFVYDFTVHDTDPRGLRAWHR